MSKPGSHPVRVLCVGAAGRTERVVDVLTETVHSPTVTAVGSVADLSTALDSAEAVDCVVTMYDLPDGTATDVCDSLAARRPGVPVVVLVEPTAGCVPVDCLSDEFAACLPTKDGLPRREDLTDALELVATNADPSPDSGVRDAEAADAWETDAWKAEVLSQLFEKLPLHVYVKDSAARIVFVTEGPVDERIHPLAAEFEGRRDIDGVVPIDEAIGSYLDDVHVIETGEPVVDKEEFFDSSGRWFLTSKVPLHGADGEVVGLIGVAREVSDRKERERQLTALSHLVRHNLRTDVNIVEGWAERLSNDVDPPLDGHAGRIVRAAARLHSTIDHQQELVSVVTEQTAPVTVDAARVAREVIDEAAHQHPGVQFDRQFPDVAPVRATKRLDRAVDELVTNSVVHNPCEDPYVAVSVERDENAVHLTVADNAPPIPETEVAVLTGEREIDALCHSTGLGLWLVSWVVRHSSGELSFASREPQGNVVTVTLAPAEHE